mmetsp:Transcript_14813/g.18314  ORF Transcript_14813/g.18314 Transcript_14813/m.18314 type:complete len:624 (-) Transcript_14813:129-2000(-)
MPMGTLGNEKVLGADRSGYDSENSFDSSSYDSPFSDINDIESWVDRGVSVKLLFLLMKEHGLSKLTVEEVLRTFVRPQTMDYHCSLAAVMKNSFPKAVGIATHFVTYSHKMPFESLVKILQNISKSSKKQAYFWIDIFAIDQSNHLGNISNPENWLYRDNLIQDMKAVINNVNNTTAILYPRDDPYLLKRSWCLFECFATLQRYDSNLWFYTDFSDLLNEPHQPNVESETKEICMFENFAKTVERFKPDFEKSETSLPHEKHWLRHAVSSLDSRGVSWCNENLQSILHEWLAEQGLIYFEKIAKVKHNPGNSRVDSMYTLATLLDRLGFHKPSYYLFKSVRKDALLQYGDSHTFTAKVNHELGCLIGKQFHQYDKAENLLRMAMETRLVTLGKIHEQTCESMEALARLLQALSRNTEAHKLFKEALSSRIVRNGFEHRTTLVSANLYGLFLQSIGNFHEANALFRKIVITGKKILGRRHQDVFIWINNLAVNVQDSGKVEKAELILRRTLLTCEHTFGPKHPCTLNLVHNLGQCLWIQGRHVSSETLFRREVASCSQVYGRSHVETLKALRNLLNLLKSQNKIEDVKKVLAKYSVKEQALLYKEMKTFDSVLPKFEQKCTISI